MSPLSRPVRFTLGTSALVVLALALGWRLFGQTPFEWQSTPYLRIDPERVVLNPSDDYKPCGWCHTSELEVWKTTAHATGYETMHRSDAARDYLERMDLRVTKRQESLCMRCHYTVGPKREAIAGVSCESCHGPARDWVDIHNDWGEGVTDPSRETPAHRQQRIARSIAAGMLRPSGDIYSVAANCFECHTVPVEELVNRGKHNTGTAEFDLVSMADSIRHNFLSQQWKEDRGNEASPPERKRVMFVVGRVLAYEFSLRGLARATVAERYATTMSRRAKDAYRGLQELGFAVQIPEVVEVLKIGENLRLVPGNDAQLTSAAEQVRAVGKRLSTSSAVPTMVILDRVMAGEPMGESPAEGAGPGGVASGADPGAVAGAIGEAGGRASPPPTQGRSGPAAATSPASRPDLPGEVRTRPAWFPPPDTRYRVVGVGKCTSCHEQADAWWADDPHSKSGQRLFGEDPKARRIAELYGIGVGARARADQICASCHLTVDAATKTVRDRGVSCESCHGAGSGFLDPHEKGGNPQLGMRPLKQAAARASTCATCHRISDERLLAAGHPSGSDYDLAAAVHEIEHWPDERVTRARSRRGDPAYAQLGDAALKSAFATAVQGRAIPAVTPVPDAPSPTPPRGSDAPERTTADVTGLAGAPASPLAEAAGAAFEAPAASRAPAPSTPPLRARVLTPRSQGSVSLSLEPLPENTKDLTLEELLLIAKRRLEQIYRAVGRGP